MANTFSKTDFKFDEPKNVASFTMRQIIFEKHPILLVSHDAEDGDWQFLTGQSWYTDDALIVGLHEIVDLDPSVMELADLPLGWIAERKTKDSSWIRSKDRTP
jgi:hypothetical protein